MNNKDMLLHELNTSIKRLRIFSCPEIKDVYSYQYFKDIIKPTINNYKDTYSVIFGDFNKLGIINNIYGHDFGTKALKCSLEIIKKKLPSNATIVRVGGDEFYIIIPNCNKENASKYCSKIHSDLANHSTLVGGLSIELAVSDSTFGTLDEIMNLTDVEVTNIKANKKDDGYVSEIFSEDFLPLKKPNSISDLEDKHWDELNKRINISIYNFIQNFRPSKTFQFDQNQITDASSFITTNFAYLINKKIGTSLSNNENYEYLNDEFYTLSSPSNKSKNISKINSNVAEIIHSLVTSNKNITNLSDDNINFLINSINKLTENLIRDNTGLLSKSYFRLFLAQQLPNFNNPLSASFISACGIKLSNFAFDHSFTDDRLAKTNKIFLSEVAKLLNYNNNSFEFSINDIHLISQGAGNYLFLYPKEIASEMQSKIKTIVNNVNDMANIKDSNSHFKIAYYSTNNQQTVLKDSSYEFINYIRDMKEEANYKKDYLKKQLFQSSDAFMAFKKCINNCIDYYLEFIPDSTNDINKVVLFTKNVHKAFLNQEVLHNNTKHTIKTSGLSDIDENINYNK